MNELELVREARVEVEAISAQRLAAGRERLLSSISRVSSKRVAGRRRPRRARRLALAAGAAAAVTMFAATGIHGVRHPPADVAILTPADQVLHAAALKAGSRLSPAPRADQWIFTRVASYSLGAGETANNSWIRFDGREQAYYLNGRLIVHRTPVAGPQPGSPLARFLAEPTPSTAYAALAALPSSPRRLLAYVANRVAPRSIFGSGWDPTRGTSTRAQLEFGFLCELLWNSAEAAPPRAEASAFSAMATIPGVRTERGVKDALGRSAVALAIAGIEQQLLLNPTTYQVTGQRTLSNGHWPAPGSKRDATIPKGRVVDSLAWERTALVGKPGQR